MAHYTNPRISRFTAASPSWALALFSFFVVGLFVQHARADLALDDRRSIERRVTIENLGDFTGWKIVAYPYNYSGGVPKLGLATFDVVGLTPPRYVDAHVWAIPPGKDVEIPEKLETEEGIKRLKAASAIDSGVGLGHGESAPQDSDIRSVREVLRIKQLTPESFELERVALEYHLEGDIEERVDCPPRGPCRGPAREPGVRLGLTRWPNPAPSSPSAATKLPTPSAAPSDPESPAALASATPTPAPPAVNKPMNPLIWVALAALILGLGLFVLRKKDSDSDSAP